MGSSGRLKSSLWESGSQGEDGLSELESEEDGARICGE